MSDWAMHSALIKSIASNFIQRVKDQKNTSKVSEPEMIKTMSANFQEKAC